MKNGSDGLSFLFKVKPLNLYSYVAVAFGSWQVWILLWGMGFV
jgi:hypothetical protein